MRLLKCGDADINFETFVGENVPPPYAILSHTWAKEEVLFQEIQSGQFMQKHGYRKIQFCIAQARSDGLKYCWVDTCCIDKTNAVELSTAINSMFRWYQNARKCYVYLEDVPSSNWEALFGNARWFKRGWTLQELIAPREVEFFSQDYVHIGSKNTLEKNVLKAAKIPVGVLRGQVLSDFSLEERIAWMGDRETTLGEDVAYSLFGILGIFLPLIPGEGKESAKRRLWAAVASPWQPSQEYGSRWPVPAPSRMGIVHRRTGHHGDTPSPEPRPSKRRKTSPNSRAPEPETNHNAQPARDTPMGSPDEPTLHAGLNDTQRQTLLDSLRFEQMDSRQMSVKVAHAETCKWLLKKSEYFDWLDAAKLPDHHGFLWMKGKPGTGKSTLMKFALTSSRKSLKDHTIVSFFFNARGSDLEKSTIGMYRSLLIQLLERLPQLQSVFESLGLTSWNCTSDYMWTIEALKGLFQQAVQSLGQNTVACFIDALDECSEDQIRDMVAFFQGLGADAVAARIRFQVFFSSRHYPHITISRGLSLVLEGQEGHDEDITRYIDAELKIGQSVLARKIRADLQEKASSIFIWVVLVVGILNKEHDEGRTAGSLQRRLREIPADLHELFRDILTRDCRNREELLLCIQWVLFAPQPLAPEQLYFAVLSGTEPDDLSAWDQEEAPMRTIEKFLLNSSKGLAEVTKSKIPTVQFIHESVRDFLFKENGLSTVWPDLGADLAGQSHDSLKQCCLRYMGVDVSGLVDIGERLPKAASTYGKKLRQNLSTQFPFFQYAVENALWHANEAQRGGTCQKIFLAGFDLPRWLYLNNIVEKFENRRHKPTTSLLYILGEYNLPALIKTYENNLHSFDIEDERYGPPILAAIACGSREAIGAMLEVHTQIHPELSTLQAKWKDGKTNDSFSRDFVFSRERGLLPYILESGNIVLLQYALVHAYDVGGKEKSTLQEGLVGGDYDALAKLLLATGQAAVDSKGNYGRTPLIYAAKHGHEAIVKLLLATGQVTVDLKDSSGQTPLSYAAEHGHEAIVKLLLATGQAAVDSKGNYGQTPLSCAAEHGHEAIVKLLLATGQAVVHSKDSFGWTPLGYAAMRGHKAVVKLLEREGVGELLYDLFYFYSLCR